MVIHVVVNARTFKHKQAGNGEVGEVAAILEHVGEHGFVIHDAKSRSAFLCTVRIGTQIPFGVRRTRGGQRYALEVQIAVEHRLKRGGLGHLPAAQREHLDFRHAGERALEILHVAGVRPIGNAFEWIGYGAIGAYCDTPIKQAFHAFDACSGNALAAEVFQMGEILEPTGHASGSNAVRRFNFDNVIQADNIGLLLARNGLVCLIRADGCDPRQSASTVSEVLSDGLYRCAIVHANGERAGARTLDDERPPCTRIADKATAEAILLPSVGYGSRRTHVAFRLIDARVVTRLHRCQRTVALFELVGIVEPDFSIASGVQPHTLMLLTRIEARGATRAADARPLEHHVLAQREGAQNGA